MLRLLGMLEMGVLLVQFMKTPYDLMISATISLHGLLLMTAFAQVQGYDLRPRARRGLDVVIYLPCTQIQIRLAASSTVQYIPLHIPQPTPNSQAPPAHTLVRQSAAFLRFLPFQRAQVTRRRTVTLETCARNNRNLADCLPVANRRGWDEDEDEDEQDSLAEETKRRNFVVPVEEGANDEDLSDV